MGSRVGHTAAHLVSLAVRFSYCKSWGGGCHTAELWLPLLSNFHTSNHGEEGGSYSRTHGFPGGQIFILQIQVSSCCKTMCSLVLEAYPSLGRGILSNKCAPSQMPITTLTLNDRGQQQMVASGWKPPQCQKHNYNEESNSSTKRIKRSQEEVAREEAKPTQQHCGTGQTQPGPEPWLIYRDIMQKLVTTKPGKTTPTRHRMGNGHRGQTQST